MFFAITLNPSIDYTYSLEHLHIGGCSRTTAPTIMAGGKGINMSRALSSLGASGISYTVIAGKQGSILLSLLEEEDITVFPFSIEGETRNAITIMHDNETHTEINEYGPYIDSETEEKIINNIISTISHHSDINVVSINGSVNSENKHLYSQLLDILNQKFPDVTIVIDASKDQLHHVLHNPNNYPDFIKPNILEFSEFLGKKITSKDELISELKTFTSKIPYILVSCGADGAVAKFNNTIYNITVPKIKVVSPTGSGDSTVAGFIYGLLNQYSDIDILKTAMACGVSNTTEDGVGIVKKEKFNTYFDQITVTPIT